MYRGCVFLCQRLANVLLCSIEVQKVKWMIFREIKSTAALFEFFFVKSQINSKKLGLLKELFINLFVNDFFS